MAKRHILTEADYRSALKEISALMEQDPDLGTPEGEHLYELVTLVQGYEERHYPIALPHNIGKSRSSE